MQKVRDPDDGRGNLDKEAGRARQFSGNNLRKINEDTLQIAIYLTLQSSRVEPRTGQRCCTIAWARQSEEGSSLFFFLLS